MRIVTEKQLRHALARLCDQFPMSEEERTAFIEHHIMAGLRGNIMQGLGNIEYLWVRRFQEGRVRFGARFRTIVETSAGIVVDAGAMLGMLAGKRAMDLAVAKAKAAGIGVVWFPRSLAPGTTPSEEILKNTATAKDIPEGIKNIFKGAVAGGTRTFQTV